VTTFGRLLPTLDIQEGDSLYTYRNFPIPTTVTVIVFTIT
jgi:hypothetical protein